MNDCETCLIDPICIKPCYKFRIPTNEEIYINLTNSTKLIRLMNYQYFKKITKTYLFSKYLDLKITDCYEGRLTYYIPEVYNKRYISSTDNLVHKPIRISYWFSHPLYRILIHTRCYKSYLPERMLKTSKPLTCELCISEAERLGSWKEYKNERKT